jgi:hypothetical protein
LLAPCFRYVGGGGSRANTTANNRSAGHRSSGRRDDFESEALMSPNTISNGNGGGGCGGGGELASENHPLTVITNSAGSERRFSFQTINQEVILILFFL